VANGEASSTGDLLLFKFNQFYLDKIGERLTMATQHRMRGTIQNFLTQNFHQNSIQQHKNTVITILSGLA